MKTQFQPEEIRTLIVRKWDELQGEQIINKVNIPMDEAENIDFKDGLNRMYALGKSHGSIEGQMKFLEELMDFFKIVK